MKEYIKFEDPEKAKKQLAAIRDILNDDSSEIGALLNNLLGYSVEESKDLREQAKKDCKYYIKESPDDRTPTEWGAYIDTPLFAAYFFLERGDEFMETVWPQIEKEAQEELKTA